MYFPESLRGVRRHYMDLCWKALDGQKHGSEQDIRKNVECNHV